MATATPPRGPRDPADRRSSMALVARRGHRGGCGWRAGGERPHRPGWASGSPLAGVERRGHAPRGSGRCLGLTDAPAGCVLVDHRRHRRRPVVTHPRDRRFTRGKTRTRRKVAGVGRPARDGDTSDITRAVGRNALLANRSNCARRSRASARPTQLGWRWGKARGVDVWTSVRDAVVLLGPSGAGKGVYVVNPRVLDAPGAVVVTSTRPDVLTATLTARAKIGPVGVISADGSVGDLAETVRLVTDPRLHRRPDRHRPRPGPGRRLLLRGGGRQLLAGLDREGHQGPPARRRAGRRGIDDLWRWSQSAPAAQAAVTILDLAEQDPAPAGRVEPGWSATLAEVVDGDEKFRGNVWAGVGRALAGLDLAAVRRRFDPAPGQGLRPAPSSSPPTARCICWPRRTTPPPGCCNAWSTTSPASPKSIADRSPRGRLDPPLTLMLDEIANFAPLPKLPVFVSAYGGAGIVTFVVIQSREQMNRTWGTAAAEAIWDAATIKGILGGITSADDLRDFSAITGERDETTWYRLHRPPHRQRILGARRPATATPNRPAPTPSSTPARSAACPKAPP